MAKGAREEAGEAGGAGFSRQQPPINPGGAREVAEQLFTGFWPAQGGYKSPGAFVQRLVQKPWSICTKALAQPGQQSGNKRCGLNRQIGMV